MKTIFIVNPMAGKKKNLKLFVQSIMDTAAFLERDVEVYHTKCIGDATEFVHKYCRENGSARFIACGGDGTLSEVLNGAIPFDDAEVGVIPMGTGNDFCRNFDASFNDISLQILGKSTRCDAIKYLTTVKGEEKSGYSVNMFNIGFDCNVADNTSLIKKSKIISGSLAYFVSILINLIKKKGANLKIEIDGTEQYNGELLLTSIANGCFCGGGIKSNPEASVKDGLISINIIKNVSHLTFISLLPHYIKGNLMKVKNIEKYVRSEKCKKIRITPHNKRLRFCSDGEILDGETLEFEIMHNAFNFVVPAQCVINEETNKELTLV